ncbi:ferric citrate ABC transporter ATP-binding protein FecE [Clostridia bacterium]|nr:ferric citrate ABC transporter ATP-binding protein FecE [Clostridia bacterium]
MVEISNLSGGYHKHDVVHNVTLNLPNGEITAVIGRNGCGKSTLLQLICGQIAKSAGDIILSGQNISDLTRTEIAKRISYLPQSRSVPDINVAALVLHGRFPWLGYPRVYTPHDRNIAEEAMEHAGVTAHRKKSLAALSGGERQKVYIAMLLAQDADATLLDEPTTYLDIEHQLELTDILKGLKERGKAVAVVLHDLNSAMNTADKIAVMRSGKLIAMDSPQEIARSGVLDDTFGVSIRYDGNTLHYEKRQ